MDEEKTKEENMFIKYKSARFFLCFFFFGVACGSPLSTKLQLYAAAALAHE